MPAVPLCVIVPRLPPKIDGLGGYTRQLWLHWPKVMNKHWHFLVTEGAQESQAQWHDVTIADFEKSKTGLLTALNQVDTDTILVQYVGYGYQNDNAPMWMPEALREWKARSAKRRIVVMFHEAWASGRPWQRVYWQIPQMKQCVSQMLALSSFAVTQNPRAQSQLENLPLRKSVRIIPLGSNFIAEPSPNKNWHSALIFGRSRKRSIALHLDLLKKATTQGVIKSIVLAGERSEFDQAIEAELRRAVAPQTELETFYDFPADRIPQAVLDCGLSLMHTQSTVLLKSTVFHLSTQLEVALTRAEQSPGPPLVEHEHYLQYQPDKLDRILPDLKNTALLEHISASVLNLSKEYFSWEEIAQSWAQLVEPGQ